MLTKTLIEKYFIAEKQESLLFIVIGVIAILVAIIGLFYFKTAYWRGVAIPLIAVAILQIIVGYTVYARSDEQRIDMVYSLDMNPQQLKKVELPRMKIVAKNFIIYRWVEIILIMIGIGLFIYFKDNPLKLFWKGFGLALFIQALLMLGADFFAERRAANYLLALEAETSHSVPK